MRLHVNKITFSSVSSRRNSLSIVENEMFVSYSFVYVSILSCFVSTVHPQNSNAATSSAAFSSKIGPTPCFLFGDYFSQCDLETTLCAQMPSECSSYIWNEVTVDSTGDVYDKTGPDNDKYFRTFLQCTEKPITLTYGYESLKEWSHVLASCGVNQSNVLDDLEGLSTYIRERRNISGIMLNNLDVISETPNVTNFTENLNCYIDLLKTCLPHMEIGIYLHAENLRTYYEDPTVDWINFNRLSNTVDFVMVVFPFSNNECTLDWIDGIFPMAVNSDHTLQEYLQVLNTAGVPKAKLHLRFELDPAAEAPSFCVNDIQQISTYYANMILNPVWILSCLVSSRGDLLSDLRELPGFSMFASCIEPPPRCPNPNITFHLYTRYTNDYVLDVTKPDTLVEAPFIVHAPIKLLIHGYTGYKDYSPNTELRPAYLQYKDLNVISVDYKELVQAPCYVQAVHNVPLVGKCTKMLLLRLFRLRPDLNLRDLHVIGFSLGAQVAGHVGRLMNRTITRITGLDPASPLFDTFFVSNEVLDKSDAQFVDVVHTNIGFKGKISPLGHLDFYANNGISQPGCGTNTSCSHVRAVEYFAESVNTNNPFWAVKCISYIMYKLKFCKASDTSALTIMGEHVDKTQRGIYYFMTNSEPPYSQGLDPYGKKTNATSTTDSSESYQNDVSSSSTES